MFAELLVKRERSDIGVKQSQRFAIALFHLVALAKTYRN